MLALFLSFLLYIESCTNLENPNNLLYQAFEWIENDSITGMCSNDGWGNMRCLFWFHCLGYDSNRFILQRFDSSHVPHHPLLSSIIAENYSLSLYLRYLGHDVDTYDPCRISRPIDELYDSKSKGMRFSACSWINNQLFYKSSSQENLHGISSDLWDTIAMLLAQDCSDAQIHKIILQNRIYDVGQLSLSSLSRITLYNLQMYPNQSLKEYYGLGYHEKNRLRSLKCRCLLIRCRPTSLEEVVVDAVYYRTQEEDYYRFLNTSFRYFQGFWVTNYSMGWILVLSAEQVSSEWLSPEERVPLGP